MFFIISEYIKTLNLFNNVIRLSPITPLIDKEVDLEQDRQSYRLDAFPSQEEVDDLV
jgi:hypothetical protein